MMRALLGGRVLGLASVSSAQSPEAVLAYYENLAQQADAAFTPSEERGKAFYFTQYPYRGDKTVGCTTCHGDHPTDRGRTRAFKPLNPLAPSVSSERLTDIQHVEKWMRRGCKDVLKRPCSVQEKADVVRFLMVVK